MTPTPGAHGPPTTAAQLASIAWLGRVLGEHGLDHWVFGGWAVDLHLGRTTRSHEDVDVAVWRTDHEAVESLLLADGWVRTPTEGDDGFAAYARGPVRLEVAFLARDEDGTVFTPLADGRGGWPAGSFGDEEGEVQGVRARVVGRAALVEDKSGPRDDPAAAAKDRADVAALTEDLRPWRGPGAQG